MTLNNFNPCLSVLAYLRIAQFDTVEEVSDVPSVVFSFFVC